MTRENSTNTNQRKRYKPIYRFKTCVKKKSSIDIRPKCKVQTCIAYPSIIISVSSSFYVQHWNNTFIIFLTISCFFFSFFKSLTVLVKYFISSLNGYFMYIRLFVVRKLKQLKLMFHWRFSIPSVALTQSTFVNNSRKTSHCNT